MAYIDGAGNTLTAAGEPQEIALQPAPALTGGGAATDYPCVAVPSGRFKTVALVVTTPITWTSAGQVTAQLYAGRTAASASDANHPLRGAPVNVGPSGTTLLAGTYLLTQQDIADLQSYLPCVGVRLVFPSAPTAGAASVYVDVAGD